MYVIFSQVYITRKFFVLTRIYPYVGIRESLMVWRQFTGHDIALLKLGVILWLCSYKKQLEKMLLLR
jgi:hypothetical protein